eukprot:12385285-Alexandrium_andersonii.AAC.1
MERIWHNILNANTRQGEQGMSMRMSSQPSSTRPHSVQPQGLALAKVGPWEVRRARLAQAAWL